MGAKNKVIDGDYKGKCIATGALGVAIVAGFFKQIVLDENTVENYEILDGNTKISGTSAVGRGLVGSFLLGPVGLLAAASAKKKGVYVVAVQFKDGKKSLIEVDEKIYKKILVLNFKSENTKQESSGNVKSQEDITEQIKKLAELKDSGILTEEEFSIKKSELLERI